MPLFYNDIMNTQVEGAKVMSCMGENILKQAENLKKTKGRIDVIELANSLGIKVYTSSQMGTPSFIAYDKEQQRYEIYVNAREKVARQRFSIAHEIAHFIEHKDKINVLGIVGRQNTYSLTAEEEFQADSLAAEILMPKNCVEEFLKQNNVSRETKIDEEVVRKLAQEFEVSVLSAIIRLRSLGYYVKYIEAPLILFKNQRILLNKIRISNFRKKKTIMTLIEEILFVGLF